MKNTIYTILMLSMLILFGCHESDGNESYTIDDLVGTWNMLTEETVTTVDGTALPTENRVADANNSKQLTIAPDGRLYISYVTDGISDSDEGSMTINGKDIGVILPNTPAIVGTVSFSSNLATIVTSYSYSIDEHVYEIDINTVYVKADSYIETSCIIYYDSEDCTGTEIEEIPLTSHTIITLNADGSALHFTFRDDDVTVAGGLWEGTASLLLEDTANLIMITFWNETTTFTVSGNTMTYELRYDSCVRFIWTKN